ncbi:MAG: hypothetical protein FWD24_01115 [Treponema sp.]|nr:hypothetical protein [Treponema sp.]
MGNNEIIFFLIPVLGFIMSLIGFVTVWIKVGQDKGRQEAVVKSLEQKTEKNEKDIAEIKGETKGIQIDIAHRIGAIEAKLDFIKDAVAALKGGRRAAEK